MKNMFSCTRNIALVLAVLCNPLHARNNNDDSSGDIITGGLLIAAAASLGYKMYKSLSTESDEENEIDEEYDNNEKNENPEEHDAELRALLLQMNNNPGIKYNTVKENKDDITTLEELEQHKQTLRQKRVSMHLHGKTRSLSMNLAGTKSASNIHCTHLQSSGDGFIATSVVKETTVLKGNHVITKTQLHGTLTIQEAAQMVSLNQCILDEIMQAGKEHSIIELSSTAVKSDITFQTPGVVVIDKDSIIGGQVINGKIVKKH